MIKKYSFIHSNKVSFDFQIPLVVILAILDPTLIVVSKSAPALIAGNSFVLKPPTQVFISLIRNSSKSGLGHYTSTLLSIVLYPISELIHLC